MNKIWKFFAPLPYSYKACEIWVGLTMIGLSAQLQCKTIKGADAGQ